MREDRTRRSLAARGVASRAASGRGKHRAARRLAAIAFLALLACVALPPFAWPVRGRVSSAFFFRHKPDSRSPFAFELHEGIDIAAPEGRPVYAAAPGVVAEVGSSPTLGNYVRVRHLLGFSTTYGHLSRIGVRPGRIIVLRSLASLGAVGSTGRATGPHLHFSIRAGSRVLPPRALLVFHSIRRSAVGF